MIVLFLDIPKTAANTRLFIFVRSVYSGCLCCFIVSFCQAAVHVHTQAFSDYYVYGRCLFTLVNTYIHTKNTFIVEPTRHAQKHSEKQPGKDAYYHDCQHISPHQFNLKEFHNQTKYSSKQGLSGTLPTTVQLLCD